MNSRYLVILRKYCDVVIMNNNDKMKCILKSKVDKYRSEWINECNRIKVYRIGE
jgi:hypothetical protein